MRREGEMDAEVKSLPTQVLKHNFESNLVGRFLRSSPLAYSDDGAVEFLGPHLTGVPPLQ